MEAKISKPGGVFFYRRDTQGWEQRRTQERQALLAANKLVKKLKSQRCATGARHARDDERTGLLNAHAFDVDLRTMHADAAARGAGYSLVLCDIDYFHNYNARYLYQPANIALRRVADALKDACRPGDLVYRYGGEEMTVPAGHRARGRDQSRRALARGGGSPGNPARESTGAMHRDGVHWVLLRANRVAPQSSTSLVDAANEALLFAKQSGRNRVVVSNGCPT